MQVVKHVEAQQSPEFIWKKNNSGVLISCDKLYLLLGCSTTMKLYEPVCIVSDYLRCSTTENLVN